MGKLILLTCSDCGVELVAAASRYSEPRFCIECAEERREKT